VTRCSHGVKLTDPTAAHRKDHWQTCPAAEFHGGRFEINTWIVLPGPLEGVGQRLIGPWAKRQLATSLADFMSGQKVREVRYVSARLSGSNMLVEKIEDRIARKASGPASRFVFREDSCSYVLLCSYLLNELRQHPTPAPS
jgi:hypothetical protein